MSAPSNLILVSIDDAAGARVSRVIAACLGEDYDFFFLLAHPGLLDVLGPTRHPHGFDAQACLLNASRFSLLVTFGSMREQGPGTASSWLASYFDEIGVSTLEIQRHLFQEGFSPLSPKLVRSGMRLSPSGDSLMWHYAARTLVPWAGPQGIGVPSARAPGAFEPPNREDLVCVTSALEHGRVTDRERYQFAISVLRAARAHPKLSFCWVLRGEEQRSRAAESVVTMLTEASLPNLWLERFESAADVVRRSRFGIAMPSTALLAHDLEQRPALLFAGALSEFLDRPKAGTFSNYFELADQIERVRVSPADYLIDLKITAFEPAKLRALLDEGLRSSKLAERWFEVASRYLALLQVLAIRRHTQGEKDEADLLSADNMSEKLAKIFERLGVIQRSTVGYKTLKLMKRLKGEGHRR